MKKEEYNKFIDLLTRELIPAMGCTEPIAIAYCAATARKYLGELPDKVIVRTSGSIVKNVKGVTVPNTNGLKGIKVAAIIGIVGGNSEKGLEVIANVNKQNIDETIILLSDNDYCKNYIVKDVDNLYIKVEVFKRDESASVEIIGKHTNITSICRNGKVIYSNPICKIEKGSEHDLSFLSVNSIYEFVNELDVSDLEPILERQMQYNKAISEEGLNNDWGMSCGKNMRKVYADNMSISQKISSAAAAGSDARMSGCSLPVVINSGSGNQGITVTLPIVVYSEYLHAKKELVYKSLAFSNLIAIHQKQYIGDLSAYCGTVCAATGGVCGMAYMDGQGIEVINGIITNSICTVGGMLCDGAKCSCAAKIEIAIDTAISAYELSKRGFVFKNGEGLVKSCVEDTIRAVGTVARTGMTSADETVLNVMIED